MPRKTELQIQVTRIKQDKDLATGYCQLGGRHRVAKVTAMKAISISSSSWQLCVAETTVHRENLTG